MSLSLEIETCATLFLTDETSIKIQMKSQLKYSQKIFSKFRCFDAINIF
jgi:hypothetical protein